MTAKTPCGTKNSVPQSALCVVCSDKLGILLIVYLTVIIVCFQYIVLPEEKRDTPDSRQRYQDIKDSAYYRSTSAECPCDDIKLKKSYKSPVESADEQYKKSYPVHHKFAYRPSHKDECIQFSYALLYYYQRKNLIYS